MTTLTIEQGNNIEIVSYAVILKLYETALNSTNVTLSGNLQCEHCFENAYDYLTGYVTEGVKRFPDLAINVTDGKYISFADPEVLRVLVSLTGNDAISSDGIGITQADANAVTKANGAWFRNNTTITSFDEFGRFGDIWIDGYAFEQCTNLTSIDLSNVVKISGQNSFKGCTNLRIKLNMPKLTSLSGNWSFNTSGITEIEDLGTITRIPGYNASCFAQCVNLTKVHLPTTCVTLGSNCFYGCTNLSNIYPVDYIQTLESGCLIYTGTFGILNFNSVTHLNNFSSKSGYNPPFFRAKQLYFPKVVTPDYIYGWIRNDNKYYHSGVFADISADILYLKDILDLYGACFCRSTITNLVINNTTPPTIHNSGNYTEEQVVAEETNDSDWKGRAEHLFFESTISNIYVPDSAVNTYKTTAIWSDKASIIKPISEMAKVATEEDLLEGQVALIEAYMDVASNSQTQEP